VMGPWDLAPLVLEVVDMGRVSFVTRVWAGLDNGRGVFWEVVEGMGDRG